MLFLLALTFWASGDQGSLFELWGASAPSAVRCAGTVGNEQTHCLRVVNQAAGFLISRTLIGAFFLLVLAFWASGDQGSLFELWGASAPLTGRCAGTVGNEQTRCLRVVNQAAGLLISHTLIGSFLLPLTFWASGAAFILGRQSTHNAAR